MSRKPGKVNSKTGLPKPVKDKFRFQSSAAILTYKTHLNKEEYKKWFAELVKVPVKQIVLAHETGDSEHDYLHTHVVFSLESPIQTTNARYFDYSSDEIIHPHIKKFINRGKPLHDALMYVCKEDPENKELLAKLVDESPRELIAGDITKKVWECNTIQEALMLCEKPSDATGIIALFNNKAVNFSIPARQEPKYKWQKSLMDEFSEPCKSSYEDRRVTWIIDPRGASGKTNLARKMTSAFPNQWVYGGDMGTLKDAATIVKGWIASGWTGHGVFINLSRSAKKHESRVYNYIEAVKDGIMCATKYTGGSFIFPIPHVIVCANFEPKYECLSLDRWDIRELTHKGDNYEDPNFISVVSVLPNEIKKRIAANKAVQTSRSRCLRFDDDSDSE